MGVCVLQRATHTHALVYRYSAKSATCEIEPNTKADAPKGLMALTMRLIAD